MGFMNGINSKKGLMLIFATAIISGFSIFINKFGVKGINSNIFTFSKNIIVAVFLLTVIFAFGYFNEIKKLTKMQWLMLAAIGFIGGSVPFLLFFRGLQLTSSAMGSFIHKTMFVYVGIFAVLFLKEKLNKKILIPALMLLAGNLLMLKLLKINSLSFNNGDLLILFATLLWAAENTLSKYVLKNVCGNLVAFGRMFFGSLFILAYLVMTKEIALVKTITLDQLSWIIITSIILLAYVVTWYNGLRCISAVSATVILLLGSVITTLLNYLFFDIALAASEVLGGLLLILGAVIMVFFLMDIKETKNKSHMISTA